MRAFWYRLFPVLVLLWNYLFTTIYKFLLLTVLFLLRNYLLYKFIIF
jgi:hypothetical protein